MKDGVAGDIRVLPGKIIIIIIIMLLFIVPYFYMFPSSYDVQSQWNSNFGFPPRNI